ncbi:hypothetical protein TNIN_155991 [Trichonephila inaurata madagascariensis]|uniref:Uncharacterized protein n=1 Tax=Trichonephila inaurata madagascariensis TaxID=2747483 RepID=A0A8X6XKN2_9ARAC|nr:hypothetical protein TNIN_155991 [Trichonephila inaurata madagascariensis]
MNQLAYIIDKVSAHTSYTAVRDNAKMSRASLLRDMVDVSTARVLLPHSELPVATKRRLTIRKGVCRLEFVIQDNEWDGE